MSLSANKCERWTVGGARAWRARARAPGARVRAHMCGVRARARAGHRTWRVARARVCARHSRAPASGRRRARAARVCRARVQRACSARGSRASYGPWAARVGARARARIYAAVLNIHSASHAMQEAREQTLRRTRSRPHPKAKSVLLARGTGPPSPGPGRPRNRSCEPAVGPGSAPTRPLRARNSMFFSATRDRGRLSHGCHPWHEVRMTQLYDSA